MLGLGYPGGPAVERLAQGGDPKRFDLPRPLQGTKTCDFSFSGLKTAVRHRILELGQAAAEPAIMADLCAGFQAAVGDVLVDRSVRAMRLLRAEQPSCLRAGRRRAAWRRTCTCASGWSSPLASTASPCMAPPLALCTDNAIMVAWAGIERLRLGVVDDQAVAARARWPLEELTAPLP